MSELLAASASSVISVANNAHFEENQSSACGRGVFEIKPIVPVDVGEDECLGFGSCRGGIHVDRGFDEDEAVYTTRSAEAKPGVT